MGLPSDPAALLWPLLVSGGVLLALLLIFAVLRRIARVRRSQTLFLFATLLLASTLLLDGELLLAGWLRQVLLALLLVCWGYLIFDIVEYLLVEVPAQRRNLVVPRLLRDIVRGLVLIGLLLLAVNWAFGVPLSSLVISSTVISAVIGLALQDLLKNVVAGMALQAEQPFAPGDWVLFNNQPARIVDMNWRATRMVTVDNTYLVVPNGTLAQANIENYSTVSPLQALHVQIMLGYQHPPNEVKRTLAEAARAAEGVLADPPPGVRLIAYGQDFITYDIKFWMPGFDRHVETRDAVMTNTWYFLQRAGMRRPLPSREIYLHPADAASSDVEQRARIASAAALLARQEIFMLLEPHDLEMLAAQTERRIYAAGEVLVRQGDTDDALFVIERGATRVSVADGAGVPLEIGRLGAGELFGELALLTGAPRSATVTASEDTETLLVRRAAIAPLLERTPALPERLGAVLERRTAQREAALAVQRPASATGNGDLSQPSLVRRIREIFGLVGR